MVPGKSSTTTVLDSRLAGAVGAESAVAALTPMIAMTAGAP